MSGMKRISENEMSKYCPLRKSYELEDVLNELLECKNLDSKANGGSDAYR